MKIDWYFKGLSANFTSFPKPKGNPYIPKPFEIITTCQQAYLETRLLPFSLPKLFYFHNSDDLRGFLENIYDEKLACVKTIRISGHLHQTIPQFYTIDPHLWVKLSGLQRLEITPKSTPAAMVSNIKTALEVAFGQEKFAGLTIEVCEHEDVTTRDDGMIYPNR